MYPNINQRRGNKLTSRNSDTSKINMKNVYVSQKNEHKDESSVDFDFKAKDYPVVEHLSNARLMPMTGPYGGLDLLDTYEYGTVPEDPSTPLESYEVVMEKNKKTHK